MDPATTAVGVAGVLGCGLAGLAGPALVVRLPDPSPSPSLPADEEPPPTYAEVAAEPGLGRRAAAWGVAAAALVVLTVPSGWPWLLWLPLVPVLVTLALVDARTRLLPRAVVLPATAWALGVLLVEAAVTGDGRRLLVAVACGLVARSVFWLLWWLRSAGLGFGDVRLVAVLGLLLGRLGPAETLTGLYLAFLVLGVPGLALALVRRDRSLLRRARPFGPALVVGTLLGPAVGPVIAALLG